MSGTRVIRTASFINLNFRLDIIGQLQILYSRLDLYISCCTQGQGSYGSFPGTRNRICLTRSTTNLLQRYTTLSAAEKGAGGSSMRVDRIIFDESLLADDTKSLRYKGRSNSFYLL